MVRYVRGFLALFIIMLLLLQLVPEEGMKKYIRFFSRLVLSLGFLYPLLSVFCDSDAFLEKIQYETFAESLREISADTAKLEYLQNDYYLEKYEEAVEQDVYRTAENYVEPYGLTVGEVEVTLSGGYEVETLKVSLKDEGGRSRAGKHRPGRGKEDRKRICLREIKGGIGNLLSAGRHEGSSLV